MTLLGQLLGRRNEVARAEPAPPLPGAPLPIGCAVPWGHLDHADVDASGLVRLVGWASVPTPSATPPEVAFGGDRAPLLQVYRYARADVPPPDGAELPQAGIVFEYLVPDACYAAPPSELTVTPEGAAGVRLPCPTGFARPPYAELRGEREILGRERIYGYGPPSPTVSEEVLALCAGLEGRVLDFGCGSGALLEALVGRGLDGAGIELDRPPIRKWLKPSVAERVTLYDGVLPTPFADASFDAVIASEVIEHIAEPAAVIAELARLTRDRLVVTVPDIAVIPLGGRHGLVPWHLLEATHFNFFTQASLEAALRPYFSRLAFGRIAPSRMNETTFHVNLAVVCRK